MARQEWRETLRGAIDDTIVAFQSHRNMWFGREHDLQSYLYHRALLRAGDNSIGESDPPGQILFRREHRLWSNPTGEQKDELKRVDLALLCPTDEHPNHLSWPVCDVVELKFPVESKTGLTEHEDLTLGEVGIHEDRYIRRSRGRFKEKFLDDYDKLDRVLPQAENLAEDARCHIIYFDLVRGRYFHSSEEVIELLTRETGSDISKVGSLPLHFIYVCTIVDSDASCVWVRDASE